MRILPVSAILSALAACGGSGEPSMLAPCPIGDPSASPEIEIVSRDMSGMVTKTSTDSSVPLFIPPQGGWVALVGVRAKNVDGCSLTVTASLRDPTTNRIVSLEERPVHLVVSQDGWGEPERPDLLDNFANLPGCPNATLSRKLFDEAYELKLRILDRRGKQAQSKERVFVVCGDPGHLRECQCQCRPDYVLGESC
jgi:hypothetical protein